MTTDDQPTHTKADLLAAASAAESPASERLIADWVAKGLIDRPDKRGLGRGRGTVATWPENQRRLFLLLLEKRNELKQTSGRSRVLPNIPVALWLYFSDEYVPVRQVRRALATYCEAWLPASTSSGRKAHWSSKSPSISIRRHEWTAKRLVNLLAHPSLTRNARAQLRHELTKINVSTSSRRKIDKEKLLEIARRVLDPENTGQTVGPSGAKATPENWLRIIEARFTAIEKLDEMPDQAFADVRVMHHNVLALYIQEQPHLAADPDIGAIFEPRTFEQCVGEACVDVLTGLGMLELAREASESRTSNLPPQPVERPGGVTHGKDSSVCTSSLATRRARVSS